MPFTGLSKEFESAHVPTLAASTDQHETLSTARGKYYVFMTVSLLPGTNKK